MSQKNYIFLTLTLFTIIFSQSIIAVVKPTKETEIANLRVQIKALEISLDEKSKLFQEQNEKLNQLDKNIREQLIDCRKELDSYAQKGNKEEILNKSASDFKIYLETFFNKFTQHDKQKTTPSLSTISTPINIDNDDPLFSLLPHTILRNAIQLSVVWAIETHKWERYLFELGNIAGELTAAQDQLNNLLVQI